MQDFVHLHNHSDYSLLDGAVQIPWYIEEAKVHGMKHLGLTDHGAMFGVLHFERQCRAAGINPIIGCEMYTTTGSSLDKSSRARNHFVLFCKNEIGYKNLLKLVSHGYLDGFYYKPRIDDSLLEKYSEGLIATSACMVGRIPQLILDGKYEEARDKALYYNNLFGHGNFYLEVMNHGIEEEAIIVKGLTRISQETEIPLIATNDIHYLKKEHFNAQDILVCIGTNKKLSDKNRLAFSHNEFYFKSASEMEMLFPGIPDALTNTVKLAEKCDLSIPQPGPILPNYNIPEHFKTQDEYLEYLTWEGIKRRYKSINREINDRVSYELGVLKKMTYAGYFLVVWDFIDWARKHSIPVGPGRGSGAGSIVAYALGITDIDPLKYNLLFERFLNPDRVSMPDFDIDFCNEGRDQVIDYVTQKYGQSQVGGICTFGTLKTKAVLKDVARVLEIGYDEANIITKLIPDDVKATKAALEKSSELKKFYDRGGKYKELFDTAQVLEGMHRHISTHACGKVIGNSDLVNYVPLYKDQKSGEITTEFTMDIIEDCGLVKMDFLGLKTLTVLKNTENAVRKREPEFDLENISETDKATFVMLGKGDSDAVFQFESEGMQKILRDAVPSNIEDLIALNALYRPGPMANIPQFVKGKKNANTIRYLHPSLKEILEPTYGVIVYQEQVMQVAQILAGFSLGKADILRRAMGKKKESEMKKMEAEFIEGAVKVGLIDAKRASEIFAILQPFAGYGFNKSHAAAYSVLAYKTAYCKANYPVEFLAANLTNEMDNPTTYSKYMSLTKQMNIVMKPPNINYSDRLFSVVDGQIFYGLQGIKGMGSQAVNEILAEREKNGLFTSFEDFIIRVPMNSVNKRMLEIGILTGVFDEIEPDRERDTLLYNVQSLIDRASKIRHNQSDTESSLFGDDETINYVAEIEWEEPLHKMTYLECLEKEKELLGVYISGHPLDPFKEIWEAQTRLNLKEPEKGVQNQKYNVIGMITSVRKTVTKAGKSMGLITVEDYNGSLNMVLFSEAFEESETLLVEGEVLSFEGQFDKSRGFQLKVNKVSVLDQSMQKERKLTQVHIKLYNQQYDHEELKKFHHFIHEGIMRGKMATYLHINDYVIKIDSDLKVNNDDENLNLIRENSLVSEVWVA